MNTDSNNFLIELILKNKFHLKSYYEKLTIIKNDRPCPEISKLSTNHKEKNKIFIFHFNVSNYFIFIYFLFKPPYLTGSAKLY